MNVLLTAIVLWLSANFNLPAALDHPTVKFVPPSQMATLRYMTLVPGRDAAGRPRHDNVEKMKNMREVVALYDVRSKTIYLSSQWTGRTVAETSVVVHEMVHHLQHAAGLRYECSSAQEKLAYEAQAKWLALFGHSLEHDFQIDRLTMLITTSCSIGMLGPY